MSKLETLKEYININRSAGIDHMRKVFNIKLLSDEDIFYQLVFCLLVPAGNAKRTDIAVKILKDLNYYTNEINDLSLYNFIKEYVRFPKQKTRRLHSFKRSVKPIIKFIKKNLQDGRDSSRLRDGLVSRINGLGYKAASHFLRNVGIRDLAIIDTHVLKYRKYFMPENMRDYKPTSPNRYWIIEEYFNQWAENEFNLAPAELDWFLWTFESGNGITSLEY